MCIRDRLRGGGNPPVFFVDVSKENSYSDCKFSKTAPEWRTVSVGLNIHGICLNTDCKAYKKEVICPIGIGIFDLILDNDEIKCPVCKEKFRSISCGFRECFYTFEGTKLTNNNSLKKFQQEKIKEIKNNYRYFDPKLSGVIEWKTLKIITFKDKYDCYSKDLISICFVCLESSGSLKNNHYGHKYHDSCRNMLIPELKSFCLICLN